MHGSSLVLVAMFVLVAVQAIPELLTNPPSLLSDRIMTTHKFITRHVIQNDQHGHTIHLDVTFDADENTVLAIVGDVSQYPDSVQTVIFHDYKTGFGVLKIINKKVCVLARALVPMKKPEDYRIGSTSEVHAHRLRIAPDEISLRDVEVIAGPRIASFCQDYATYFIVATPIDEWNGNMTEVSKPRRTRRGAAQTKAMWCFISICLFSESF